VTEPDVTLSDYALVVECALLAWLMIRTPGPAAGLRAWTTAFLACTGVAALLGGTVHGFFVEQTSAIGRWLWKGSLLAIGAAALAAWMMAAVLVFTPDRVRTAMTIATILAMGYAFVIVFVSDVFLMAVAGYVPAAIFLLLAFEQVRRTRGEPAAVYGTSGLILTFVAASIQQLQLGLHPSYFNHNALYHVVQAVALALIFAACRGLVRHWGGLHAHTT